MTTGRLRIVAVLATLLALGIAGGLGPSAFVGTASAYVLANGCDEYDPARAITYRCVPDRSTFYTPDGVNPSWVPVGTEYPGETYGALRHAVGLTINDHLGIPPPAPYHSWKDYCSNPWWAPSPFEGKWNYTCYRHDVCYGSQLGRKYCDVQLWHNLISDCKTYGWYNPARYACFADAAEWYVAVRQFGAGHYVPRTTSYEP